MTWLRWDTDAPFSDVVGDLSTALGLPPAHAYGLYNACCLGFGKHRPDGQVVDVSDANLEGWARWGGRPGRFAAAFRARCTSDGNGSDPAGTIRGWWRQRALLDKQTRDAQKRKPPKNPRGSEEETPEKPARNDTTTTTTTPSGSTERHDTAGGKPPATGAGLGYHTRCVIALNSGLRENPLIGSQFNEVSSSQMQGRVDWEARGIPVEFAERIVREKAATYRPSPRNPQPHSLAYFDRPVTSAWEDQQDAPASPAPRTPAMSLPRV